MGAKPDQVIAERARTDTLGFAGRDELLGSVARRPGFDEDDVRLGFGRDEATDPVEPRRDPSGVFVVLAQPVAVFERRQPGRGDDTGLAHPAAQ